MAGTSPEGIAPQVLPCLAAAVSSGGTVVGGARRALRTGCRVLRAPQTIPVTEKNLAVAEVTRSHRASVRVSGTHLFTPTRIALKGSKLVRPPFIDIQHAPVMEVKQPANIACKLYAQLFKPIGILKCFGSRFGQPEPEALE